jgi:alpha-amylase
MPPIRSTLLSAAAVFALAGAARADTNPVWLQWFETRWETIEHRMPDYFIAGYDQTWLPPVWRAADATSPGYDCFDRFDLGAPGNPTAYGTEQGFRAVVDEFHRAGGLVTVDLIMNHNSGRNGSEGFYNAGGYPGFAMRLGPGGSDFWGDFHDGSRQSTNPNDPNYDVWTGDLVGLIDIAHEESNNFIRQPTTPGNPQNIPAGTIRNQPNPANTRFYPDTAGTPRTFVNPALAVGDPLRNVTLYPFNLASPSAGDPVLENSNSYLMRSTRWMLEDVRVDGFRLDAAKHIPQWFWNNLWDSAVYQGRIDFAGTRITPFSFGEVVDSNSFTQSYTRKDGFGHRDALDLNGAGQLRDLLNANGFGSWQNVLSAHLDTQDDGFNNGTLGVTHVFSHDNGSAGNGGSVPPLPGPDRYALPQNCYLLFRPGPAIIYHHSREFIDLYQFRGFWPREGNPTALGAQGAAINNDLVKLVQLSNGYARGEFNPLNSTDPVNQSNADVLVFERRKNVGGTFVGNCVVGVNDSYANGVQFRSVQVAFPAGTRLRELTGNSEDAVVDSAGQIPQTLVVDVSQRVLLPVPNNRNAAGVAHHKGYVVYAPPAPSGTLSIVGASGTLATEAATVPSYKRRLTPMDVVTGSTFTLRLSTSRTDPLDAALDDFAAFRIDQGFRDFNASGGVDFGSTDAFLPGFERFLTTFSPLHGNPGLTNGTYEQVINTSLLSEGPHYISAICFRNRASGTDPIYTDFRKVIYVDRLPPTVTLEDAAVPISNPVGTFRITTTDRTVNSVHLLLNPPAGDPLSQVSEANRAPRHDRFEWRRTLSGLRFGANTVVVVAFETNGRSSVSTYTVNATTGSGDLNADGLVTIDDLYEAYTVLAGGQYVAAADVTADGQVTIADLRALETALRPNELDRMAEPQR